MVDPKQEIKEFQEVKYVRELAEYWNAYMYSVINEIYVGVAVGMGLPEKEAYKLAKNNPKELKKGFFDNIFQKFKSIFDYKVPKFRTQKNLHNDGTPMTTDQWSKFNKALSDYWKRHTEKPCEDITLKSYLFGKNTSWFKKNYIDFKFKSIQQINSDYYKNKIPSSIDQAYTDKILKLNEKKIMSESMARVAMHVTEAGNGIEEAIRKVVTKGIEDGKGSTAIASDLFWDVEKAGVKGNTAESMRKNWNRISVTETQSVYEAGILAPFEEEAAESLDDNDKAKYFLYIGGSCKWCRSHQGTLVRLVPASFVRDKDNDSLESMGIHDPNTDIAIWIGKNNVGKYSYKEPAWKVCTPAHPHGVATFEPIDLAMQEYNEVTNRVERKQLFRDKYVPKRKNFELTQEEKESRKPRFVSTDRVSYNDNLYERVSHAEYDKAYAAYLKDPRQAIPVDMDSTSYRKIFEAAEKNSDI
jgi:hypothetical protein